MPKLFTLFIQWMCVPSLLTQGLVRRRQFDGRFTQRQDAASDSNMEAVLVMKIALTQKKNAINDAHLKVKSFCLFLLCDQFFALFAFISLLDASPPLKSDVMFLKLLQMLSFTAATHLAPTGEGFSRNDPWRWVMRGGCIPRLLSFHICSIISHFVS